MLISTTQGVDRGSGHGGHPAAAQGTTRAAQTPAVTAAERDAPCRFGAFTITEMQSFPPPAQAHCWVYVTLNAEIALSLPDSPALQALLHSPRARVSIDSQWLWWALRRKYPRRALAKLSGSDLIHTLAAHCAQHGQRLLLLGASPAANAGAVLALRRRCPGLEVAGFAPPRYVAGSVQESAAHIQALDAIHAYRPDYVVLGLGATKEQRFAWQHLPALDGHVTGLLCFGGAIDMASGQVQRAPRPWQKLGVECVYRVLQQPSRLGRFIGNWRLLPALALKLY